MTTIVRVERISIQCLLGKALFRSREHISACDRWTGCLSAAEKSSLVIILAKDGFKKPCKSCARLLSVRAFINAMSRLPPKDVLEGDPARAAKPAEYFCGFIYIRQFPRKEARLTPSLPRRENLQTPDIFSGSFSRFENTMYRVVRVPVPSLTSCSCSLF
ncbi:hypothetical protein BGY98DRAFT_288332 [Russula aff. rugulosa BPL654]|nr:hypothetical protein BGY98DRAFT_288332 [Russula aff. rugulosa BPL654]